MIAVDTNVLVYAHRAGLPSHELAVKWLRHLAEGPRVWALPVFCIGEFVRVVTHPRVLQPPSTLDQALGALHSLQRSPSLVVISPGGRYLRLFAETVRQGDARGNMAFDAQIAAVCREHRVSQLLTMDRDFSRFPGLTLLSPHDPID